MGHTFLFLYMSLCFLRNWHFWDYIVAALGTGSPPHPPPHTNPHSQGFLLFIYLFGDLAGESYWIIVPCSVKPLLSLLKGPSVGAAPSAINVSDVNGFSRALLIFPFPHLSVIPSPFLVSRPAVKLHYLVADCPTAFNNASRQKLLQSDPIMFASFAGAVLGASLRGLLWPWVSYS